MKSLISAIVIAVGVGGFGSPSHAQAAKKQPHPDAVADEAARRGKLDLPGSKQVDGSAGGANSGVAKPTTGDAVVSGGKSTAASKQD